MFFENILGGVGVPIEFTSTFTGMPTLLKRLRANYAAIGAHLT
jgi:hypothetical protein